MAILKMVNKITRHFYYRIYTIKLIVHTNLIIMYSTWIYYNNLSMINSFFSKNIIWRLRYWVNKAYGMPLLESCLFELTIISYISWPFFKPLYSTDLWEGFIVYLESTNYIYTNYKIILWINIGIPRVELTGCSGSREPLGCLLPRRSRVFPPCLCTHRTPLWDLTDIWSYILQERYNVINIITTVNLISPMW